MEPIATVSATSTGGRNGRAALDGGGMALAMSLPTELGGAGDAMTPEQLFALGYASCFGQAVLAVAKDHGIDGQKARVTCAVTLNKADGGFALSTELTLAVPGADKAAVEAALEAAHKVCPYSKATAGNMPVTLTAA